MRKKRLARLLRREFGQMPDVDYHPGDMASIRSYHDDWAARNPDAYAVDEITWNDLGMDGMFQRMNPGLSASGEQLLYHLLRCPAQSAEEFARRKRQLALMEENPDRRLALQLILHRVGCSRKIDLRRIFTPEKRSRVWLVLYSLLALMIPISLVLAFTLMPGGFLLAAIFASVNGIVHELSRKSRECDYDTVNYAVATIQALERVKRGRPPRWMRSWRNPTRR